MTTVDTIVTVENEGRPQHGLHDGLLGSVPRPHPAAGKAAPDHRTAVAGVRDRIDALLDMHPDLR